MRLAPEQRQSHFGPFLRESNGGERVHLHVVEPLRRREGAADYVGLRFGGGLREERGGTVRTSVNDRA